MIQYCQDYDELYPDDQDSNGKGWAMQVYPYIKTYTAFQCPDDQIVRPSNTGHSTVPNSYAMPDNCEGGAMVNPGNEWLNETNYAGMAGYYAGAAGSRWTGWSAAQVQAPATTFIIVEFPSYVNVIPSWYGSNDTASAPSYHYPCDMTQNPGFNPTSWGSGWNAQDKETKGIAMHSGGWNYGFVDGHIKWMQPQQTIGAGAAGCYNYSSSGWGNNKGMWTVNSSD